MAGLRVHIFGVEQVSHHGVKGQQSQTDFFSDLDEEILGSEVREPKCDKDLDDGGSEEGFGRGNCLFVACVDVGAEVCLFRKLAPDDVGDAHGEEAFLLEDLLHLDDVSGLAGLADEDAEHFLGDSRLLSSWGYRFRRSPKDRRPAPRRSR